MVDMSRMASSLVNHFNDPNVSPEKKQESYEVICEKYDETLRQMDFTGHTRCCDAICSYIQDNRDKTLILDVGAGTGLVGTKLYQNGFRNIHALDPSRGMLNEAKKKSVYTNFYCDFLTSKPNKHLNKDYYDVVTSCASISPGHLPYDAIIEMIRLTKPGGIVCLCCRLEHLEKQPEYAKFFSLCEQLEKEGKWMKEEVTRIEDYLKDACGVIIVYRVV